MNRSTGGSGPRPLRWLLIVPAILLGCSEGRPPVPKVLLIGIDGIRVDVLAEVDTPVLDGLAEEGAFHDGARNVLPTVSGPNWSSMLIGVVPEKHGVFSNDFAGNRYALHEDFLTRIEEVRPELNTFVAADWLPLVTDDSGGPVIGSAPDVKVVHDGYELGWSEADRVGVDAAVQHLRTADPDALFVYIGAPDEISHETGSIGMEYRAAIEAADAQVGELLEALRTRPTYADEDWLVLVSTDHGRREDGGHGGESEIERTIFFLAHGPSVIPGRPAEPPRIVDLAVTALTHMGIPIDPGWELDGRPVALRR